MYIYLLKSANAQICTGTDEARESVNYRQQYDYAVNLSIWKFSGGIRGLGKQSRNYRYTKSVLVHSKSN